MTLCILKTKVLFKIRLKKASLTGPCCRPHPPYILNVIEIVFPTCLNSTDVIMRSVKVTQVHDIYNFHDDIIAVHNTTYLNEHVFDVVTVLPCFSNKKIPVQTYEVYLLENYKFKNQLISNLDIG